MWQPQPVHWLDGQVVPPLLSWGTGIGFANVLLLQLLQSSLRMVHATPVPPQYAVQQRWRQSTGEMLCHRIVESSWLSWNARRPWAMRQQRAVGSCTVVTTLQLLGSQELIDLAERMAHGVGVRDRYRRLRKYSNCFKGAPPPPPPGPP